MPAVRVKTELLESEQGVSRGFCVASLFSTLVTLAKLLCGQLSLLLYCCFLLPLWSSFSWEICQAAGKTKLCGRQTEIFWVRDAFCGVILRLQKRVQFKIWGRIMDYGKEAKFVCPRRPIHIYAILLSWAICFTMIVLSFICLSYSIFCLSKIALLGGMYLFIIVIRSQKLQMVTVSVTESAEQETDIMNMILDFCRATIQCQMWCQMLILVADLRKMDD